MKTFCLLFVLLVPILCESSILLCEKCNCKNTNQGNVDIVCEKNIASYVFNETFWQNSDNETLFSGTLKLQNFPMLTLDKEFPTCNLTYLDLEGNSIVNITDSVFKNLQALVTLILSRNRIEIIHPDAFRGLQLDGEVYPLRALRNLHLDYNQIHSLDQDIFEHTTRIEVLTLSHNPLRKIDQQTLIAITSLYNLKKLDLSYTEIATIPQYFFHTPKYLQFVDLSGNNFVEIPQTLEDSQSLTILYFNNNPIVNLTSENGFPNISTLKTLYLSDMDKLVNISKGALSNLTNLEEFYCYKNPNLVYIHHAAFWSYRDGTMNPTWPPIKKLHLQHNRLASIDMQLVLQWKDLIELDLTDNPWTCECENQWMVDELMPIYLQIDPVKAKSLKCAAPIEMVDFTFYDIFRKNSEMRCLDYYGHRPERDGALLVGILAGVLITIPLILFIIYSYQRHWFGIFDSSPAAFSRQFYKRTVSDDGAF